MEQHCKVRMRSWKRYELSFKTLNQKLGEIRMKDFRRHHLHKYVQWRSKNVQANTVNRDIACIKKMFSFALEMGVSEQHPLVRFPLLPVQERAFRVLTLEEFRYLVQAMDEPSLRAMVVVMGETGIRKKEAIKLSWERVDFGQHILTIEQTKSRKVREIPLSSFACEALQGQVRYLDSSYVFVNTRTGNPWVSPEKAFKKGCEKAGLKWVGFHDLRRFRATQWVRSGIDVRTVKELLGHTDIKTTLKYARFVKSALREVREAQEVEEQQLKKTG